MSGNDEDDVDEVEVEAPDDAPDGYEMVAFSDDAVPKDSEYDALSEAIEPDEEGDSS